MEAVSWCEFYAAGENISVTNLYTKEQYRGHGYATELLATVMDYGRKNGAKTILLDDMSGAPAEHNIYFKLGFQIQTYTRAGRPVWVKWRQNSALVGPERKIKL